METEDKYYVKSGIPITPATHLVEVTAPSNLSEGYILPIDVGGEICNVTVPKGGVTQGQKFTAGYTAKSSEKKAHALIIPVGHWRDGLCDCFRYGCFHAMLCNSYCFPIVAISQVMTRLNLNPCAQHGDAANTFMVAVIITLSYIIFNWSMNIIYTSKNLDPEDKLPASLFWSFYVVTHAVWLYTMWIIIRTRNYIRNKYHIPSRCCGCIEDILCALYCTCCSISQMGRHTTNYDTHRAQCFTKNGLDLDVPSLDDIKQPPA